MSRNNKRAALCQNHGQSVLIAENNDWQTHDADITAVSALVGAPPLSPSSDPARGDAGIVQTLEPGAYSVVVAPDAASASQNGIGLVEVYDASPGNGSRLVNISSRGWTEAGARQMIVGVVLSGSSPSRLLIRSVGPGLRAFGIERCVANPALTLHRSDDGTPALVGENDDWWNSATADHAAVLMRSVGAFDLASRSADSVILQLLEPGMYSAIVGGADFAPGVVLTEIYDANGVR